MGSEVGEMLPAAPSLDDMDDYMLSEILLRLPPQPSSLPRASAVSKRWHSIACDPGFRRSFRRRHRRNPPLLGFFDPYQVLSFVPTLDAPDRVLSERFSFPAYDANCYQLLLRNGASRHGLVLVISNHEDMEDNHIMVWDPVTGDQYFIDIPQGQGFVPIHRGTVLRDAGDVHFRVVLVGEDDDESRVFALVYSSKTSLWSDPVYSVPAPPEPAIVLIPIQYAVLVGDSLYWQVGRWINNMVMEFNLKRQSVALIMLPVVADHRYISVIRDEGGGLGCLSVSGFTAQLWKRKTNGDGVASWVKGRAIELGKLLSLDPDDHEKIEIAGYAEENNVVFLNTAIDLFTVRLQSLQFKLLEYIVPQNTDFWSLLPFECVFTAETPSNGPDEFDHSEQDMGSPE